MQTTSLIESLWVVEDHPVLIFHSIYVAYNFSGLFHWALVWRLAWDLFLLVAKRKLAQIIHTFQTGDDGAGAAIRWEDRGEKRRSLRHGHTPQRTAVLRLSCAVAKRHWTISQFWFMRVCHLRCVFCHDCCVSVCDTHSRWCLPGPGRTAGLWGEPPPPSARAPAGCWGPHWSQRCSGSAWRGRRTCNQEHHEFLTAHWKMTAWDYREQVSYWERAQNRHYGESTD